MIEAVIFDLDGVLITTDDCHYEAWKQMANEEGIYFDRNINERLRGVSRMESLEIILEKSARKYTGEEKRWLAARKNGYYVSKIAALSKDNIMPGALGTIKALREIGIPIAVGSSSKNTPAILKALHLQNVFDAVADGNDITYSKPNPEVFLMAAERLKVPPENCLVVEDADAGIEAGRRAGMMTLGVGSAKNNPDANFRADNLEAIDLTRIIKQGAE